jgi:hypothetical protein
VSDQHVGQDVDEPDDAVRQPLPWDVAELNRAHYDEQARQEDQVHSKAALLLVGFGVLGAVGGDKLLDLAAAPTARWWQLAPLGVAAVLGVLALIVLLLRVLRPKFGPHAFTAAEDQDDVDAAAYWHRMTGILRPANRRRYDGLRVAIDLLVATLVVGTVAVVLLVVPAAAA